MHLYTKVIFLSFYFAECDPGEYGENCKLKCSNNCKNPPCNAKNGFCSDAGCNPGFKGDICTTGLRFIRMIIIELIECFS